MATVAKTAAVAEIRDAFRGSSAAVLTEYRGLTVAHLKELRRTLAGNATYAVVKNTLTKIAAADAGIDGFDALLEGPSAIAFVSGDPVTVAKVLRDFSKTNPLLVIKGGMLDGKPLSADEVRRLADLESRESLLARLAGAFQASLTGAISLFAAPLSQAARALGALQAAAEADPSVLPGGSGTPAESPIEQASTEEPPAAPVDAQASTEEPPAESPVEQASTEEPVASGDAADAAVAADVLAREESSPAGDPAPEVTAPEMPAVQSLEEPPVESSEDPPT